MRLKAPLLVDGTLTHHHFRDDIPEISEIQRLCQANNLTDPLNPGQKLGTDKIGQDNCLEFTVFQFIEDIGAIGITGDHQFVLIAKTAHPKIFTLGKMFWRISVHFQKGTTDPAEALLIDDHNFLGVHESPHLLMEQDA